MRVGGICALISLLLVWFLESQPKYSGFGMARFKALLVEDTIQSKHPHLSIEQHATFICAFQPLSFYLCLKLKVPKNAKMRPCQCVNVAFGNWFS
jgi:hypothetical protein